MKNLSCVRQTAYALQQRLPLHVDLDDLLEALAKLAALGGIGSQQNYCVRGNCSDHVRV